MRIEGSPPPPLTLFPLTRGVKKNIERHNDMGDPPTQNLSFVFCNQDSESQDHEQIHCILLYFVLVCWMSFLSQCLNGLLPEAAAVSQMITSTTFSYMIYWSPHFHICHSCVTAFAESTHSHSHRGGRKLSTQGYR